MKPLNISWMQDAQFLIYALVSGRRKHIYKTGLRHKAWRLYELECEKPGARTVVLSVVRGPLCFRMAVCDVNRGLEDGINHNAGAGAKGGRDNAEGSTHPRFRKNHTGGS